MSSLIVWKSTYIPLKIDVIYHLGHKFATEEPLIKTKF